MPAICPANLIILDFIIRCLYLVYIEFENNDALVFILFTYD
jgi:hypothetical protein